MADKVLQKFYPGNDELRSLLRESNMAVCSKGAWVDLFQGVYSRTSDLSFDEQIALCDKRMYNMNALYFEKIATMGAIASRETDKTKISALANFGKGYGMGLQAVNDIADFVPPRLNGGTTEKTGHDAYRDVMFGKMTYPSIWLLNNGSENDRRLLEGVFEKGLEAELPQLEELTKTLVSSGAIDFAKRKVMDHGNEAKRGLRGKFSKEERASLAIMCAMFRKNRYYDALKEFK
jgi:geranylgeranyl pyrophosphate synthase